MSPCFAIASSGSRGTRTHKRGELADLFSISVQLPRPEPSSSLLVGGRALLPKAHGVPLPDIPFVSIARVGFEPNLSGLKDRQPHQKSNGPCCARRICAVGQEALESSSADFQSTAKPSQLPTQDREDIAANVFVPVAG